MAFVDYYKSAYLVGTTIVIAGVSDILDLEEGITYRPNGNYTATGYEYEGIYVNGRNEGPGEYDLNTIQEYTILYKGVVWKKVLYVKQTNGSYTEQVLVENDIGDFAYYINVVENENPLKLLTITNVINRLLDVAEPIRKGQKPRFRLRGMNSDGRTYQPNTPAAKYDKILAPQFSFTKQTLRECLQQVGQVIHGEPRIIPVKDNAYSEYGGYYYEVYFEEYGGQEISGIATRGYTQKQVTQQIAQYCTSLDTSAENLVNQLDKMTGVITEPYGEKVDWKGSVNYGDNYGKSVRTESTYTRIQDDNLIIATQYPIYTVEKLEAIFSLNDTRQRVDITPYVFEKTRYDFYCSSYNAAYPKSKAYAIYFSQGKNNIYGLNFKEDKPIYPAFGKYAINNILSKALNKDIEISSTSLPLLCFRITYTPIYNSRVNQSKSYLGDLGAKSDLIYNQTANLVETKYYGEALKGVVARMGNIEKTYTYILTNIKHIPKAGQKFDDNYYISTVATEILPTCFKCTIGLSKDFNRLSQYIGVKSEKRYSEVSLTQALERNVIYKNYVVVGNQYTGAVGNPFCKDKFLTGLQHVFNGVGNSEEEVITNAVAIGSSAQDNYLPPVVLPVVSSAFGNAISFSWQYEDNFSAGPQSTYQTNGKVSGYFQDNVRYTDYYGRAYYYDFTLNAKSPNPIGSAVEEFLGAPAMLADAPKLYPALPNNYGYTSEQLFGYNYISADTISTTEASTKLPYVLRKDNREVLQVSLQVDFISNDKDLIIGSALAATNPLVGGKPQAARLYVLPDRIDKFTDKLSGQFPDLELGNVYLYDYVLVTLTKNTDNQLTLTAPNFPPAVAKGKSWVIVTPPYDGEAQTVEDEYGNTDNYTPKYGGELLLGKNIDVQGGTAFPTIYFTIVEEVFDKTVWYDKK